MTQQIVDKNRQLAQKYTELLSHEGDLVALKMLKSLEGLEKIRKPAKPRTLCQLISQTRYIGRMTVSTANELSCYMAPGILGFKEMPKEAWKRYVGWQMATEEAARKTMDAVPRFKLGEYSAVLLSPLQRCPVTPDVVIFFGNVSQMLVIIAAYLHSRGGCLTFSASGMGVCGTVIVSPIQEKKPTLGIPGNAWKLLALPSDTDLVCGVPTELLEEMAENAEFIRAHGGSRYPPAWQHIDWDVQPPIGDLLKENGRRSWLE